MGQNRSVIYGTGLFEGVHMHNISFFLRMGGAIVVFSVSVLTVGIAFTVIDRKTDECIGNIFLFVVQRVKDILNGLTRIIIGMSDIGLPAGTIGTTNGGTNKSVDSLFLFIGKRVPNVLNRLVR